ncbi:MAG: HAD family phosphatase [Rhodobacteraceae bacterium]|nr:HAD family phosphatase [Paracoccaceae bacterium]MCC5967395.1 HAD family phosphatase [Natronohydrobacter sp.]
MSGVGAVVFDIGNVLLGWNPQAFYDREIGVARRKALFAEVDLEGMNLRVDRGAPLRDSAMALAQAHPEWADEIALWHDRWSDMLGPVIEDNVALLQGLRAAGMPVFALSNFGTDTFEIARKQHLFLDMFDERFISGHLGVLKPEPEIYAMTERATRIDPSALFFIDDRLENIEAAAARGWQTHHFSDPHALREHVASLGLEVSD